MLPHTDLADGLGCALDGTAVAVDAEQRTTVPGVWAAGRPPASAGGPRPRRGAHRRPLGRRAAARHPADPHPAALASRRRLRAAAAALDTAYAVPPHWSEQVTDDTVVCRCEEVTAGAVRAALDLGAGTPAPSSC